METISLSIESVTSNAGDSIKKVLSNNYVSTILIVLAILYGSLAAPKLPKNVVKVVKHPVFLLLALTAIAYLASNNGTIALIAGLAICITLIGVKDKDKIIKVLRNGKVEFLDTTSGEVVATTPISETTKPVPVIETPQEPIVTARVEGTPEVTEVPKMPVADNNGNVVRDSDGKVVVATPTIAVDDTGKVVVDEEKKPILVPPKAAITETGEVAKDNEGKVIVAPAIVEKDENGELKQDLKGDIVVNSCMVSVDGGNSVKLLYRTRGRSATGGKGLRDDYNIMFGVENKAQENTLSKICVGSDCLDGYEPECLASL